MRFSGEVEWVNDLGKTLTELHEIAHKKEVKYKAKVKEKDDDKSVFREYKPGEMVLLHTHILTDKLKLVWQGPYEVLKVINGTTYQ